VLRLWVSSVNYAADVCIGDGIIKQCFDAYRKLRNTARYMLGSLHDFDPAVHAVPYDELPGLDRYLLSVFDGFMAEAKDAYDGYAFSRVFSLLQQFAVSDLSNFYLDIAKDRLYISASDEARRRSCQTVLDTVLRGFVSVLAPILPHMAEDIWQALPYAVAEKSVFQAGWGKAAAGAGGSSLAPTEAAEWEALRGLRDIANKAIEQARNEKTLGASLEAKVVVHTEDPTLKAALDRCTANADNGVDSLKFVLLTSGVEVVGSAEAVGASDDLLASATDDSLKVTLGIARADGVKCERCWCYSTDVDVSEDATYYGVCKRCDTALSSMGFPAVGKWLPKPAEAEAEAAAV